jgi:signal transduction histidine kinase
MRGKLGPFVGFLGIAALVLGGLGYVTHEALRIEGERQQANAARESDRKRAEKERELYHQRKEQEQAWLEELRRDDLKRSTDILLALWRLDSSIIPALAREDSRPYPHYVSLYSPFPAIKEDLEAVKVADRLIACEAGQVYLPSPLMTAPLPKWMLLHFQIDPINGWTSPQVIPNLLRDKLRKQPIELALDNVDDAHKRLLDELKAAYPARSFLATLRKNGINVDNNLAQQEQFNSSNSINPSNGNPGQNFNNGSSQNPQQPQQGQLQGDRINEPANGARDQQGGRGGNNYDLPDPYRRFQVNSKAKNEGIWAYLNDGRNYASLETLFPSKKLDIKQAEVRLLETQITSAKDGTVKKRLETKLDLLKKEVEDLKQAIQQPVEVGLGSMQAMWLPSPENPKHLVLIRPAQVGNTAVYQGILLDWVQLQENLKDAIAGMFDDAKLIPVAGFDGRRPERSMTALPVELDPGPTTPPQKPPVNDDVAEAPPAETVASPTWTPLRVGLALAWAAALIALGAVGLGGWSLLDLSERRIRFVSAVTHELRTPLTTLRLYLDLLNSGLISEEKQRDEYLKTLSGEADRLQRLIGNVLDFARLENSRPNIEHKPVPLTGLLEQLHATWSECCAASGKDLQIQNALAAESIVTTDQNLVEQILGNLIDNARKYSQDAADAHIYLRTRREGDKLVIEVEDRGPGVTKREKSSIFRPFRRGRDADVKAGGVGLGLALATRWASFIGGRLSVKSGDGGVGACFRLELPA